MTVKMKEKKDHFAHAAVEEDFYKFLIYSTAHSRKAENKSGPPNWMHPLVFA